MRKIVPQLFLGDPLIKGRDYAQILILVNLILVKNFSFLIITRHHELGFGRNLVEIHPTSLPDLPKQLRHLNNSQKTKILETIFFRKTKKS